jgi:two-component system, OmpR family, sensor kinase
VRLVLRPCEPSVQPGQFCCIEVQDAGIGIAPHELPQVFDRHFRGQAARRCRPDGSGLGLPIAQALARAHGGRVELFSAPQQGTLARLTLPAMVPDAATAAVATQGAS